MPPAVLDALLDALALLLPVDCAGCGAPDRAVCARCRPALTPDVASRRLADGTLVFSGLGYEGVPRAVLLAFKEKARTDLARHLAPALAAAVREATDEADADASAAPRPLELVAVPASRRARRRRGFDPVSSLLLRAGLSHARVFAPARPHAAQKSLSLEQRASNQQGVFVVRAHVAGRRFLLVDDVVTTGATLLAAAAALRAAGGEVVAAAAVASTPKLFGPSPAPHRERSVTSG